MTDRDTWTCYRDNRGCTHHAEPVNDMDERAIRRFIREEAEIDELRAALNRGGVNEWKRVLHAQKQGRPR